VVAPQAYDFVHATLSLFHMLSKFESRVCHSNHAVHLYIYLPIPRNTLFPIQGDSWFEWVNAQIHRRYWDLGINNVCMGNNTERSRNKFRMV
jgi:hypothetical protein